MPDEIAWVVERASSPVSQPEYLMVRASNTVNARTCIGDFDWTAQHIWALRFAREADAILFVGAVRMLSNYLVHSRTIPGLRIGDEAPRVCEHIWVDPTIAEKSLTTALCGDK